MGTLSDTLGAVATRLLSLYGEALTVTRVTEGAYNPDDSGVTDGTTTTFTTYGTTYDYIASEVDGTVIQRGDVKLVVQPTAIAPLTGDVITIDSVPHRVLNVERLKAQGVPCAYVLQLRV